MNKNLLLFFLLIISLNSIAQKLGHKTNLFPKDAQNEQSFGFKIVANSSIKRTAISAPKDNKNAVRSGAVYIFDVEKEKQLFKIKSPNIKLNQAFGYDISLNKSRLLIGAPGLARFYKSEGKVYLYKKTNDQTENWTLINEIKPNKVEARNQFGYSVKLLNNIAIIGAPGENRNTGSVYIFKKDKTTKTWKQIKKLTPEKYGSKFGYSIDFNGENLVIGAPSENNEMGSIYIYNSNWNLIKHIRADRKVYLGCKLRISDNFIFSTAHDYVSGKIYIFKKNLGGINNWGELQKIEPKRADNIYDFGKDFDLYNNHLIVGAPSYSRYHGCLYIFKFNNQKWIKTYDTEYSMHAKYESRIGTAVKIYNEKTILSGCIHNMYNSGYLSVFNTKLPKQPKTLPAIKSNKINKQITKQTPTYIPIKKTKKKTIKTRILKVKNKIHVGNLIIGNKLNRAIKIKNLGNASLTISNIFTSEDIHINNKSFKIAPKDFYTLNFELTKSSNTHSYIELVSNKTTGNNYINIASETQEEIIYKLDYSSKIDLNTVNLGSISKTKLRLKNSGNKVIKINSIIAPNNVKINTTSFTINPNEEYNLRFKILNNKSGNNTIQLKLITHIAVEYNVNIVSKVALNANEFMKQQLINTPTMLDKRLIINMQKLHTNKVLFKILSFNNTAEIKSLEVKNKGFKYFSIPLNGLQKGAYNIQIINTENNSIIQRNIFNIF